MIFYKIYDLYTINYNKKQVILCHYPIIDWAGIDYGSYMVHGHIHDNYVPRERMYCCSVECTNFEPVTFEELQQIYSSYWRNPDDSIWKCDLSNREK